MTEKRLELIVALSVALAIAAAWEFFTVKAARASSYTRWETRIVSCTWKSNADCAKLIDGWEVKGYDSAVGIFLQRRTEQ